MSLQRHLLSALILLLLLFFISGCIQERDREVEKEVVVVFKHGKIAGDPEPFRQLLDRFEKENPKIKVKDEILPASTDEQHQFYVINLEGRSTDFDVLSMDVIWAPEFARAGWLRDLSHLISEGERDEFFGLLCHSINGAALAVKQLLQNPEYAQRLGANGREHVRQNFLLTRHLREYLLLFLSLYNTEDIIHL